MKINTCVIEELSVGVWWAIGIQFLMNIWNQFHIFSLNENINIFECDCLKLTMSSLTFVASFWYSEIPNINTVKYTTN